MRTLREETTMQNESAGASAKGISPDFARHASQLLEAGKVQEALDLCLAGTKRFPWYATGLLTLGKCYDTLGRSIEAMLEYRRALKLVSDSAMVQSLLERAEKHEQEAFEAFAESRRQTLEAHAQGMRTFEQYAAEETPEQETTVEFLLKQLQGVKRITPLPEDQAPAVQTMPAEESGGKIVTATLAEIYASQGQYREAVRAYRVLVDQRPADAQRYHRRMAELEELARAQKPDNDE